MESFRLSKRSKTMETKTTNGNSAEQIGHDEDLLMEILLRVPTKSVLKFRFVSKQWMSLISSTRFRHSHARTLGSLKPRALFIDRVFNPQVLSNIAVINPLNPDDESKSLPPFDFLDFTGGVRILESCGGLLLCESGDVFCQPTYFICNPTTRECKILPTPPVGTDCFSVSVSLAFDPLRSPHYKIIFVSRCMRGDITHIIHIFSSETNSWSSSKIEFTIKNGVKLFHAVFLNGAIHWYSDDKESQYFDVDKQCLKTMPMPMPQVNDVNVNVACRYFGECVGHLNLVFAHEGVGFTFSIFEMEEDYSNWYLKHRFSLQSEITTLWPEINSDYIYYLLISVIQSEEGDLMMFAACTEGRAISYNCKNGTLKVLQCPYIKRTCFPRTIRACKYFETLACV